MDTSGEFHQHKILRFLCNWYRFLFGLRYHYSKVNDTDDRKRFRGWSKHELQRSTFRDRDVEIMKIKYSPQRSDVKYRIDDEIIYIKTQDKITKVDFSNLDDGR